MFTAELALFIGGMALNIFVLPTVFDKNAAVPRAQSVPTSVFLIVFFVIPYSTLEMYLPAFATAVGAVLWGYIAVYRSIPQKPKQSVVGDVTDPAN